MKKLRHLLGILKQLDTEQLKVYRFIDKEIKQISLIHNRFKKLNTLRFEIIEGHCIGQPISLDFHNKYHDIGEQVIIEIKNYFTAYKRFLNNLTVALQSLLKHEVKNNIRFKSFGSMLESITKIDRRQRYPLFNSIYSIGNKIDSIYLAYRDKALEHSKTMSFDYLQSTDRESSLVHFSDSTMDISLIPKDENIRFFFLRHDYYGTSFYIHVELSKLIPSYSTVKKGERLPMKLINTNNHFEERGIHYHFFPSVLAPKSLEEETGKGSPSIKEAMEDLYRLCEIICDYLIMEKRGCQLK